MLASQNTATNRSARLRTTIQVPELKKSCTLSKTSPLPVVVVGVVGSAKRRVVISSQEQLSHDVPRREGDSCKRQDDDRREDVDAQSGRVPDGMSWRRAARSASR